MTASCAPRTAPPCRPESHFSSWGLVGVLLGALVLLLPVSSDACDDPPRFNSMRLRGVAQATYNPGDTIEYECRLGYKLKRPPLATSAVCQSDSTWTPLQEACTRKLCRHPGEPTNGQVKYVNGTLEFGSQIHYVCNEGFNLIGQNILYCELVGENVDWSDNPPLCQVMSCSPPPKIQNGKYTRRDQEEFTYNDEVTYSCDPSDGPDEYSLIGESRLVCSGNDKWSSDPPECKVVKCEHPVLENGRLVSGFGKKFYYKATVVFECNRGFYLNGSDTVVCGANSTWEPAMPTCINEHSSPSDESPPLKGLKTLGVGIKALIVICVLGGGIGGTILYKYHTRKRGEAEVSTAYSTYQNKSTIPADQAPYMVSTNQCISLSFDSVKMLRSIVNSYSYYGKQYGGSSENEK